MVYKDCKIWGPYTRKDKRQHVVVKFPNGKKVSVSYPKFLTEKRIGKYLEKNETIDHKDCNFLNNAESNLKVLPRKDHIALDIKRAKDQQLTCVKCSLVFIVRGSKLSQRNRGKAGPFCSRKCSGRYGAELQNGKAKPIISKKLVISYTTNKKTQSP